MRVNVFEDRKAQSLFVRLYSEMSHKNKKIFTHTINELFDAKSTAEEGVFKVFKVTLNEVETLADALNQNK